MKVMIAADSRQATSLVEWLEGEIGPWRDGHWRVTQEVGSDGKMMWAIECNSAGEATRVALRWA